MARIRDWVELGKDTISSLKTSDVATLYGTEWPSTRKMLIAELARDLQAHLLPASPPQTEEYAIAAFNRIANTVGGDIYDFVPLPDGRLAVLFGDASGHGMAAGLVMAVAHAAFRTQLDIDPCPAAIVNALNRILCRTGGPRSFFACCYVLL